jgi:hypothetical protein
MTRTAAMLVILAGLAGCASLDEGTDMSRRGLVLRPAAGTNSCAACAAYPQGYPQTYQQAPAAPPSAAPAAPPSAAPAAPPSAATAARPSPPQYLPPASAVPGSPPAAISQATRPPDNTLSAAAPAGQPAPNSAAPAGGIALTAGSSPAPEADAGRTNVASVNSRRIALNYEVKDAGQGGAPPVELWFTRDGKPWEQYQSPPSHQPPFIVEVKEEGRYGFALVARNADGVGRPPQPKDPGQVQVEVDLTPPVVQLLGVQPDPNPENRAVTLLWQASDKNLGPQPIALSWAREPAGTWFPITCQLENTGRYLWRLPAGLPPRVWLRVEAADLAGNVGMASSPEPIQMEPSPGTPSVVTINSLQKAPAPPPARIAVVGVEPVPEPPARAEISGVDFSDK